MKHLALSLVLVLGIGCSPLPRAYQRTASRSLVQGESTPGSNVLIRNVNGGKALRVKGRELGNSIWLEPGTYRIGVTCLGNTSWGETMGETETTVKVERGTGYLIKAKPTKLTDPTPEIEVVKFNP